MSPEDELESLCVYLTQSPLRDNDKHTPLRAKALKLLAHAGATALPELKPYPSVIVVLRVPIAPSTVSELKTAMEAGVPLTSLRWLEASVQQRKVLPFEDFPAPQWEIQSSNDPSASLDGMSMSQSLSQAAATSRVFQGCRIFLGALWLRDETMCTEVERQLIGGRAKILPHDRSGEVVSGVPTHVVCAPFVQVRERTLLDTLRQSNRHIAPVTPFWVDSCVAAERLLQVRMCVLFSPLWHEMPLRDMKEKRVSITLSGFQQKGEDMWNRRREVLSRLAELLGAKYSERMRRRATTHVVADSRCSGSDKVKKAREWGIQVVSHDWLLSCAAAGKVVAEEAYSIEVGVNHENSAPRIRTHPATVAEVDDDENELRGTLHRQINSPGTQSTPRRASRRQVQGGRNIGQPEAKDGSADAAINLFKRLTAGLEEQAIKKLGDTIDDVALTGGGDGNHDEDDRFRGRRSRSGSRDAVGTDHEWSLDASQSQVIVHRDLTPPPTPQGKTRSASSRVAKRPRMAD